MVFISGLKAVSQRDKVRPDIANNFHGNFRYSVAEISAEVGVVGG